MGQNDDLSRRIKSIRVALNETQARFAARVGCHRVTLANCERGNAPISRKLREFIEEFDRTIRERKAS